MFSPDAKTPWSIQACGDRSAGDGAVGVHGVRRSEELPASQSDVGNTHGARRKRRRSFRGLVLETTNLSTGRSRAMIVMRFGRRLLLRERRRSADQFTRGKFSAIRNLSPTRTLDVLTTSGVDAFPRPRTLVRREPSSRREQFAGGSKRLRGTKPSFRATHRSGEASRAYRLSDAPPAAALRPLSGGCRE